jgi:anti-anti-sigma regulatory factor
MTESSSFFIRQRVLRGCPLIEISGTIDHGGGNGLCAAVVEAAGLALLVVVDASEVSRVDAEGLRYLVRAALLVEQLGGQLRLVAGPALQQARAAGMIRRLPCYPCPDEAVAAPLTVRPPATPSGPVTPVATVA